MAYLNEDGLAKYDGLIKQWVTFKSGTVDGIDPLLNWQKTETAGAVAFFPLPAAPLDPVVNFMFTETGPAEGEKSPTNPSIITGVSSVKVTRCGKNLIKTPYVQTSTTVNDVTFTVNDDGSVTVNGTASNVARFYLSYSSSGALYKNGLTYTLSGCPSGGSWSSYYLGCVGSIVNNSWNADTGSGASVTPSGDGGLAVAIAINTGTAVSNLVFRPQLELGSTATFFEPYEGADYTVNLGGTYYGGFVDLSTGVMTVTHFCTNVSTFYQFMEAKTDCILVRFRCDYYSKDSSDLVSYVCDLFPSSRDTSDFEHVRQNNDSAISATLYLAKSRLDLSGAADSSNPTDAEWLAAANAWVAEHPFDFVSMLKNPYTVQLTPTQIYSLSQPDPYNPRTNTVYSDQISVLVGYPKSPQATSTELTNAIVSLGGNI